MSLRSDPSRFIVAIHRKNPLLTIAVTGILGMAFTATESTSAPARTPMMHRAMSVAVTVAPLTWQTDLGDVSVGGVSGELPARSDTNSSGLYAAPTVTSVSCVGTRSETTAPGSTVN